MIALELWHLKRICDKYGLDYQEIDNTLTYSENKEHLVSLIEVKVEERLDEWRSKEQQYMKEHALSHYIMCARNDETTSEETGPPLQPRFSLATYIQSQAGRPH